MKTLFTRVFSAVCTLAVSASLAGCGTTFNQQLSGHWKSSSCEPAGNGIFLKRDFTLTESTWNLTVTIYNDAACTVQFLGANVGGNYQVKQASQSVSGATEVDYQFSTRTVTPLSSAAASTLQSGMCGTGPWSVGKVTDIGATGCAALGFPSNATCPTELDLNQINGDSLFFGDRSADLCKARPGKLGAYPVSRVL